MPDLNGVEAFREIKKLAPDTPVVFMTGGADASPSRGGPAAKVLTKPFDIDCLLQFIAATVSAG